MIDDSIKTLTEEKDIQIGDLKKDIDLLNNTLFRANKKLLALQHEIEELRKTGDIKNSLKEYQDVDKNES